MRNKIIYLVIFCLFICSGCDVRYTLTIDDEVSEEINLSNYTIHYSDDLFISPIESFSQEYAYSGFTNSENNHLLNKNYNNIDSYISESALFDMLSDYDFINVKNKKVKIKFNFSMLKKEIIDSYGKIDNLEVNIFVPYFVTKHNADKVINHNYVWTIDDLENDDIVINFDMSKPYNFLSKIFLIIFFIALAIGIIFVVKYLIDRNREANEI